jgi:DNA end-binding protein Ku
MARSIWEGAISFGLVNVPVKVYSAVSHQDIRFHQLHDEDGVRIKQKRICPADNQEVPYEHIVRGYEIGPSQYVVIEPEELEALDPKSTHTIDIEEFVMLDEIDPMFFDKPYVLAPAKGGATPYALLIEAMQRTGRVAIAHVVLRTKEHVVVLKPYENAIAMFTLNYANELLNPWTLEGTPDSETELGSRELKMAEALIESLAADFEPEKYRDTYRERVMDLIEAKAEGKHIAVQPELEGAAPVIDLMAALERSIANSKSVKRPAKPRKKAAASTRTKATTKAKTKKSA